MHKIKEADIKSMQKNAATTLVEKERKKCKILYSEHMTEILLHDLLGSIKGE